MFLHQLDLTTALRPSLLPEETLLFVQDAVGLYQGYAHRMPLSAPGCLLEAHANGLAALIARPSSPSARMARPI